MDGDEILDVLKQIRDESHQTNQKLESLDGRVELTNQRLESLDGRVEFLEKGFDSATEQIGQLAQRLEALTRRQTDSEIRLVSEVLSLADVTREVRDLLSTKLDDHQAVLQHEERLKALETQIADRPPEP